MCAMSPRLLRPRAAFHPEAIAWRSAVVENGGTVNGVTLNAVSDWFKAIYGAGLRNLFYRVNLLAGDQLSAALVPQIKSASPGGSILGNATDGNNLFVNGDYTLSTGLDPSIGTPNNSKYLLTGLANTEIRSLGNGGFCFCLLSDPGNNTSQCPLGQRQAGIIWEGRASSNTVGAGYRTTAAFGTTISVTSSIRAIPGRYICATTQTNEHKIYLNGEETGSSSTTETVIPSTVTDFYVFTGAQGSPPEVLGQWFTGRLGFYGVTQGLNATQAAALDAANAAYLSAIGRT